MLFNEKWAKRNALPRARVVLTKEQREEIIALFLTSPEAASRLAIRLGLASDYAYKLARARGVAPRTGIRWGKLRETPCSENN